MIVNSGIRNAVQGFVVFCASMLLCSNVVLAQQTIGGAVPQPVPEFPTWNWWNTDVSQAPVDPQSSSYIQFINSGSPRTLTADFGGDVSIGSNQIYGFPYITGTPTQLVGVLCQNAAQSKCGSNSSPNVIWPIPPQAATDPHWIECGDPGNVDDRSGCGRHMLIVQTTGELDELENVYFDGTQWNAYSATYFDLTKSDRPITGWPVPDTSGLAIFPGLVRYDEVYNAYGTNVSLIKHAFRVTVRASNGKAVYPATAGTGSTTGALPMGARLRLKGSFNISGYSADMQKIFKAMKTYGLIVADIGTDMAVSGTYDNNWNKSELDTAFASIDASNFEVIQLGWQPPLYSMPVNPNFLIGPTAVSTGTINLLKPAPAGGAVVTLTGSAGLVTVPASVTVAAGQKTATFQVTPATAVTSTKTANVVGNYSGGRVTTVVKIEPPIAIKSVTFNPNPIASGATTLGTVTLNEGAPSDSIVVGLFNSNPSVANCFPNVRFASGQTTATFSAGGKTVSAISTTTITAKYEEPDGTFASSSGVLTIDP